MLLNRSYSFWLRSLFVSILLIGICLRFVNLDQKVYWIDEVHTSLRVSGYTRTEFVEQAPNDNVISAKDLYEFQQLSPEKDFFDTITALASSEHSPLYYLIARLWMQWFGSSITVTRSLAAVISLLAIPCIYWLSLELFASSLVGYISIALLAVSPLHILYAQEAREYSLLTVTILLSSATLLWATKQKNFTSWVIYTITVALGLYAHPLAGLVIFGHGVYLLLTEKFTFTKTLINYVISSLGGLIAFSPWIFVFIFNGDGVGSWVTRDISLSTYLQRWMLNLSSIFFDIQIGYSNRLFNIETGQDIQLHYNNPLIYLMIAMLALIGYSIYFLCRQSNQKAWLFILILIGITALTLGLPDLISGGQRSTIGRYIIACYLGIEIAVAYCLANLLQNVQQYHIWRLITVILISLGIISSSIMVQSDTWWNKYSSYYNAQVAQIINQADKPLIISNAKRISRSTSLSYLLKPETKIILLDQSREFKIPNGFSNIFLFRPLGELLQQVKNNQKYKLKKVHKLGYLWHIKNTE